MFPSDNGHCWAYVKTKTHVSNSALANWMDSRKQTILVDTALVLMRKSQHVFRMLLCQSAWPHRFPTRLPWLGCVKESKRGKKCRVTWVTWVIWVWFFIAFQKIDHCWFLFDPPMPQKWRPAKTIQNPILIPIDPIYFRANGLGILLDRTLLVEHWFKWPATVAWPHSKSRVVPITIAWVGEGSTMFY